MAANLVSSITNNITADLISRVASALGIDGGQVESAFRAGVPALLASLGSLASSPKGAAALNAAVVQQQPGILANLANMIGSSGQRALIDSGTSILTSLLGGSTTSALIGAISKYVGINEGISRSLMGLLGPIVMGGLGQQQRASGLDASGMANLLSSQKDNILRAIPPGMSRALADTGILDNFAGTGEMRREPSATRVETASRYTPPPSASSSSSQWSWLLPALGALAIVGIAWHLLSRPAPTETATAPPPATKTEPSPVTTGALPEKTVPTFPSLDNIRGIKAGDVDVGAQVADTVSKLRTSLMGITDKASAESAVTPLKNAVDEFNNIAGMRDKLSPENKKALANALAAAKPSLDRMFDQAMQIPGVSQIIKPSVDSIRTEIDTLSTA